MTPETVTCTARGAYAEMVNAGEIHLRLSERGTHATIDAVDVVARSVAAGLEANNIMWVTTADDVRYTCRHLRNYDLDSVTVVKVRDALDVARAVGDQLAKENGRVDMVVVDCPRWLTTLDPYVIPYAAQMLRHLAEGNLAAAFATVGLDGTRRYTAMPDGEPMAVVMIGERPWPSSPERLTVGYSYSFEAEAATMIWRRRHTDDIVTAELAKFR
jgi:hypothetical protein